MFRKILAKVINMLIKSSPEMERETATQILCKLRSMGVCTDQNTVEEIMSKLEEKKG